MKLPPCRKLSYLPEYKKKNHYPCISGDTAKMWKLRILGTLGMPG